MLRLDEGVLEAAFELVHSLDEKGWFSELTAGSSTSLSLNGAPSCLSGRALSCCSSTRLVSARSTSKSACSFSSGP